MKAAYSRATWASRPRSPRMIAPPGFGAVDMLVNNAGIQFVAKIEDFPEERWDAVIATNLSAAFHTAHAALPLKIASGAESSTSLRHTAWSPAARRRPTSPPSTASSD